MNARTPWILSAFYYLINESINERIDNNNALITLSSAASFSSASFSLASLVRDSESSFNFCSCNGYISVYFYLPSHTHYRETSWESPDWFYPSVADRKLRVIYYIRSGFILGPHYPILTKPLLLHIASWCMFARNLKNVRYFHISIIFQKLGIDLIRYEK